MNAFGQAEPVSTEIVKEAEGYYLQGMKFLKARKIKKALQTLNKALELNPSHVQAQAALNNAKEALEWSRVRICKNCGGLVVPRKNYPEIDFEGFCSQCGQKMPIGIEVAVGLAELFGKVILFASFPIAIFVFSWFPIPQLTPQGLYNIWGTLLEAVFLSLPYTPFFLILFLLYPPSWQFAVQVYQSFAGLQAFIHPALFLLFEIVVFFLIIFLWTFLLFTPIIYIHRKSVWTEWRRQKYLLLFALLFTALIVLTRLYAGVFY